MSFHTVRYLYCDGPNCRPGGDPYTNCPHPNEPINEQRRDAAREGWHRLAGDDICPECWETLHGRELPAPTPDPR
jgi:hypothetical protein